MIEDARGTPSPSGVKSPEEVSSALAKRIAYRGETSKAESTVEGGVAPAPGGKHRLVHLKGRKVFGVVPCLSI